MVGQGRIVVVISAQQEWACVKDLLRPDSLGSTPFGETFEHRVAGDDVTFCHGGWGKIDAAASAQFVISEWHPALLLNLGTCGGIKGRARKGENFLIDRTIVYDIIEGMADAEEAIRHYQTDLDLSWLGDAKPAGITRGTILSADRDLMPQDVERLTRQYDGRIVDWESASIARVCKFNAVPCLILRGVSDLVDASGGEALGNLAVFEAGTASVMPALLATLPIWLDAFRRSVR